MERMTKVTEKELERIRQRYKLYMGEVLNLHTPSDLGRYTSVAASTANKAKRDGVVPQLHILLSLARFMKTSPVSLYARLVDEPIPGIEDAEDSAAILRDLPRFAGAVETLTTEHKIELSRILMASVAASFSGARDKQD